MSVRFAATAAVALALSACGSGVVNVPDKLLQPCPGQPVERPVCLAPPAEGTERSQADVFANESACYQQAEAWRRAWEPCAKSSK